MEFYAEVFGSELQLATFKDFQAPVPPSTRRKGRGLFHSLYTV